MNILITGGASGLGEAITMKLAAEATCTVYFTYFKSRDKAKDIEESFRNAHGLQVDFGDEHSLAHLIQRMHEMNLDMLINNAITGYTKNHFHKIDGVSFLESFKKNVMPTVRVSQEAIKIFRKKKFGKILTILTAGLVNTPPIGWSEYTANKAYLHSLSKSWAVENAQFNISSNTISPGLMMTDLTRDMDERLVEMAEQAHPLKKLLTPGEVADTVAFYMRASQQVNGTNMIINSAVNVI